MKTKQHGKGLSHREIVKFSNRLAYQGYDKFQEIEDDYSKGWCDCAKYFAHQLRKKLREEEQQ